jgi:PadR family transcriptional regulator PadR
MKPRDLIQGMLDLLILRTLRLEAQHGWGIAEHIKRSSNDVLFVQQGSLYPALHRLEARGWVQSAWGASENGRRAKFYTLTPRGAERLEREQRDWERLSSAIAMVLLQA